MKLLTYTTRNYLFFSILFFIVISFSIYFILRHISHEEIDERMESTHALLVDQIKKGVPVESFWPYWEIQPLSQDFDPPGYSKDTVIITPDENEEELFQQLRFMEDIQGTRYLITIRTPQVVSYNLLIATSLPILVLLLLWMAILFFVNRRISLKIWKPFRTNLDRIARFSVYDSKPIELESSSIDELEELSGALARLTQKGMSDFRNLREFTENASHEIQTPLSIIQTQLEQLMQSQSLEKELAQELDKMYLSVQRLSRVNKSLLLLSKIENRHFTLSESINLSHELTVNLSVFQELIDENSILLTPDIRPQVMQPANQELFRILVNNVLGNAIKHNRKGGNIGILLRDDYFEITNTGQPSSEDPNRLFERFSKADPSSQSPGLGLAIAKEICELHDWRISYQVHHDQHQIKVKF